MNWQGGGDIKPNDITEWDVPSLKRVAMEFPDLVAQCPQRTHAILTKYTGLRSFYEQSIKGSPLDYENAGVYSSALLDAYTDYKSMWKQVQTYIWEVDNGQSSLTARPTNPDLEEHGKLAKGDFDTRLAVYKDSLEKDISKGSKAIAAHGKDEEPLEPNKVVPYKPSLMGLDQARRDARFEMIKIVREVIRLFLELFY